MAFMIIKRNYKNLLALAIVGQSKLLLAADATDAFTLATAATPSPAATSVASSQPVNGNETVLDTVEVSAVSVGRGSKVANMDVSTTVLTREQIQASPQIFLDQMINKQLGIWTTQVPANQVDPTGAVIGMRGFGNSNGEKVLVMVDGVPINDGYFKTINWNLVPRDTIERIEIVRGGGAASLWGNLAEGGVINIVTRAPGKDEKTVNGKYGSFDTKVGEAAATLFYDDTVKVGLNVNTIYSNGYNMTPDPSQSQTLTNLRNFYTTPASSYTNNGMFSTYYTPWEGAKLYLKLNASELVQSGVTYANAGNQWYKYDYRGGGEMKYSNTGSFNFNTFYNYSEMDKQNGGFVSGTYNTVSTAKQTGIYANTNLNAVNYNTQLETIPYQTGGGSAFVSENIDFGGYGKIKDIKMGIDLRGTTIWDNNNAYNPTPAVHGIYTGTSYLAYNTYTSARNMFEGLFAQGTYTPFQVPLDITLGLRQDWWQAYNGNISLTPVAPSGKVGTTTQTSLASQAFNQFNPRIGAKYSFDNGIDLRASLYRNYAAPGMNQLYRTYFSSGQVSLANPNLTPETNFGQEIGLDFTNNQFKTSFTFFHNQVQNYVNRATVCGSAGLQSCSSVLAGQGISGITGVTSVAQNLNEGNAVMIGGEASIEFKPVESVNLNFGITRVVAYLNGFNAAFAKLNAAAAANGTPIDVLGHQLGYVQPLTITAGGSWDMKEFVPGLAFNWLIKSWPTYYSNTLQQHYGSAQYNPQNITSKLGAATIGDLSVSYQATKLIGLSLSVQNIGNKYYIATPSSSTTTIPTLGMPFNMMGGINLSF